MNKQISTNLENNSSFHSAVLRWIGGKQQLVPHLSTFVPKDIDSRTYHEPFVGGGSLFFNTLPQRGYLSDVNIHLIAFYKALKKDPNGLYRRLSRLSKHIDENAFYSSRDSFNRCDSLSSMQAARFLFLNRTCFNGIFRVNLKGAFNVPYGKLENPYFPSRDELLYFSNALKNSKLCHCDYKVALAKCKKGDFVYLDPPYPPLNGTAFFTHYTIDRFLDTDQSELAQIANKLDRLGCLIMISNADTPRIRLLYPGWNIHKLKVTRWVSCKSVKYRAKELVITNY